MEGTLLKGDIKDRGILAKCRLRAYTSKVRYKELHEISSKGGETAGFLSRLGWAGQSWDRGQG